MPHTPPRQAPTVWLLLLLVALPLAVVAGFGIQLIQREEAVQSHQRQQWAAAQLQQIAQQFDEYVQRIELSLTPFALSLSKEPSQAEQTRLIRQFLHDSPLLDAIYLQNAAGERRFPPQELASDKELAFLERTERLWQQTHLFDASLMNSDNSQNHPNPNHSRLTTHLKIMPSYNREALNPALPTIPHADQGWISWFEQNQSHPLFWQRTPTGDLIAFELMPMRVLSDLINSLPTSVTSAHMELIDDDQRILYQWGIPKSTSSADLTHPLPAPLSHWALRYYAKPQPNISTRILIFSAIMCSIALFSILLAVVLFKQRQREAIEAQQRVNFVNHVSHELKTPLTNIRMYSELLEPRLEEDDAKSHHYLQIITQETLRLSRLIENVLNFSRLQKQTITLHCQVADLGECISAVIAKFTPSLQRHHLHVQFTNQTPPLLRFDSAIVEQVLNNLLSNAEKYAHQGERVLIKADYHAPFVSIQVQDFGPGIAPTERENIFKPFYRIHSSLTEGVSGTGIGLSLSKELAQLHGGDLSLIPSAQGSCFVFTLRPDSEINP